MRCVPYLQLLQRGQCGRGFVKRLLCIGFRFVQVTRQRDGAFNLLRPRDVSHNSIKMQQQCSPPLQSAMQHTTVASSGRQQQSPAHSAVPSPAHGNGTAYRQVINAQGRTVSSSASNDCSNSEDDLEISATSFCSCAICSACASATVCQYPSLRWQSDDNACFHMRKVLLLTQ